MAFHQDNDIIGAIALCLDVPDMVRFSMAHRNGSLMIGLRRLFYWLKNVFGFIWWILFCSWIHFIQTILFYTFPYFSFTFICCRIIHILSWIWVCTHLFLCFCTSHTFLCVFILFRPTLQAGHCEANTATGKQLFRTRSSAWTAECPAVRWHTIQTGMTNTHNFAKEKKTVIV